MSDQHELVLSTMSYEAYIELCDKTHLMHLSWRTGQTLFYVLEAVRPDLTSQIRGTSLDPFYLNERLGQFYIWVKDNWEKRNP